MRRELLALLLEELFAQLRPSAFVLMSGTNAVTDGDGTAPAADIFDDSNELTCF